VAGGKAPEAPPVAPAGNHCGETRCRIINITAGAPFAGALLFYAANELSIGFSPRRHISPVTERAV